jgi:hypothetical protein
MVNYGGNEIISVTNNTSRYGATYTVHVSGINLGTLLPVNYYKLSMFDNSGTIHYWTDTIISTTNAPSIGGTYVTSTFTVQGSFTV